jgi:hypothetical protein
MRHFMRIARLVLVLALAGQAGWLPIAAAAEQAAAAAHEERAQRVKAFVEAHQPELAKVLSHLEKRKPAEYARAIEELDRSVQPLTSGKAKDQRLHELQLQAWQARTRVELLGARLVAGKEDKGAGQTKDRDELERQLREAIAAELDIRSEQLAYRKQRSAAWYDRQINRLSTKREELITARLKALLE